VHAAEWKAQPERQVGLGSPRSDAGAAIIFCNVVESTAPVARAIAAIGSPSRPRLSSVRRRHKELESSVGRPGIRARKQVLNRPDGRPIGAVGAIGGAPGPLTRASILGIPENVRPRPRQRRRRRAGSVTGSGCGVASGFGLSVAPARKSCHPACDTSSCCLAHAHPGR